MKIQLRKIIEEEKDVQGIDNSFNVKKIRSLGEGS